MAAVYQALYNKKLELIKFGMPRVKAHLDGDGGWSLLSAKREKAVLPEIPTALGSRE